jgi:hypothetical protein
MRAVALGRPAASVDELPIAPRYLRADWLQTNRHVCFWHLTDGSQHWECPLSVVKQTSVIRLLMSASGPSLRLAKGDVVTGNSVGAGSGLHFK